MSFALHEPEANALLASLDSGSAIPTRWYSDPAIFSAELARIHHRAWHYVAHVGELRAAGDFVVRELARVPILLVRAEDGGIRGFLNICRHRGYPVALADGCRKRLQCQYHGWTYGLDGALVAAPRSEGDPSFDAASLALVPIQVHQWGAMIWANLALEAPSFQEWIAGMPEHVAAQGLRIEDHVFAFDHTWEIEANWKVFQDNTIECYHCPTTHPELARALEMNMDKHDYAVGGPNWIRHRIPFRPGVRAGITFKAPEDGSTFYYHYLWVFPTTYLQFAGRGFDIGSIDVVDVDRIRFHHTCFLPASTPPEILEKGRRRLAEDATILQDVDICRRVQAGHVAGLAPTGRLLSSPEFLVRHFQKRIVELVAEA